MGSEDKFCLKWNNFQTNITSSFSGMRMDSDFFDVTLACDGDKKIMAHKVILAASSSFFGDLLKHNQHPHPLFYMRGLNYNQLGAVVDFIYYGEVNIFQDDLDSFLALSEELKLKGLNSSNETQQEAEPPQYYQKGRPNQGNTKIRRNDPKLYMFDEKTDTLDETDQYKTEAYDSSIGERSLDLAESHAKTSTTYEKLDETISSMMENLGEPGKYSCKACGKNINHKGKMINHIEGNHIEGVSHPCSFCKNTLRSRESLRHHVFRYHKI